MLRIIGLKSNKYILQDNSFCFFHKTTNNYGQNNQQGRFIGINARLVLAIYDCCMENNSEGLLLHVFLDF